MKSQASVAQHEDQPEQLWRDLTVWFEDIAAHIERDLTAATGLTGPEFQVLAALGVEESGSRDQLELREELHWSASRLSHQLRRMRGRGLCDTEEVGRGTRMRVALTSEGRHAYKTAQTVHATAVQDHLLDTISPEHRSELRKAVARGRSRMRADQ